MPVLNPGDRIMFKKDSKEWKYGNIVKKVNDRSYIVVDSFGNQLRRNRRFITKTVNNDYDSSELLYEDDVTNYRDNIERSTVNTPDESSSSGGGSDSCLTYDEDIRQGSKITDQSVEESSDSSVYYEADCDSYLSVSDPEDCNTHKKSPDVGPLPIPPTICSPYTTRSGRISRPPERFRCK